MLSLLSTLAFADPIFSVERGLYDTPVTVALTAGQGGALQYSLGGAAPARPYVEPLEISRTTVLRATETLADGTISPIVTHTYVFVDEVVGSPVMDPAIAGPNAAVIADSLRVLPTVSIALPSALSLVEAGGSVEWIDPEGDESQVDCGVHIVGGTSWAYAKASIRLNFREEYGPTKWEHDVYGEDASGVRATDSFDAITLRSGNHDTVFYLAERGQHLRNLWVDETQLAMGHVMPHGRFAHAYVNGVYHGLFHVRERFGAGFMESYFGGDEADYETMTGTYVEDGTGAGWAAATAVAGDFAAFQQWVSVPQYLDYMVMNYYAGNAWDWYSWHNWMTSGPTTADARGGFIFHANDNDITLKYEWDVNILNLGGPSDVFPQLVAEGHPDFQVALADAIHRNFESDGPLTTENATARYERVADLADDAIWVESARWGLGWWDHDGEWVPERDALLTSWFPRRTDETLRQLRSVGWYPLQAPVFDVAEGVVGAGTVLAITSPGGELWVTTDGRDPRLPGGEVAPTAASGLDTVVLDRSTVVQARIRDGARWGPIESAFYEVDGPSPAILNEWNAAEPDALLADGDTALGRLAGNGGDWIELVVTEDGTDLRGWRITMEDRIGPAGEISLSDDPLLADLRAGTLLTIAEDLPEDAAYDPDGGDWRFHLRAGADGSGRYVS
ncbi:MAG: CotH kinase family protein, partial [Deltaproteobacteria bacterium]|nr:CotH kinase family protein [Deltaproteobacteria bacterium]